MATSLSTSSASSLLLASFIFPITSRNYEKILYNIFDEIVVGSAQR